MTTDENTQTVTPEQVEAVGGLAASYGAPDETPTMSAAIEAAKAELEFARYALHGAEEAYEAACQAFSVARERRHQAYEGRAANARNVGRLERALALLERGCR